MSFRGAGNASEPMSKAERGAFFSLSATTWNSCIHIEQHKA
jgi:hypothetical protein